MPFSQQSEAGEDMARVTSSDDSSAGAGPAKNNSWNGLVVMRSGWDSTRKDGQAWVVLQNGVEITLTLHEEQVTDPATALPVMHRPGVKDLVLECPGIDFESVVEGMCQGPPQALTLDASEVCEHPCATEPGRLLLSWRQHRRSLAMTQPHSSDRCTSLVLGAPEAVLGPVVGDASRCEPAGGHGGHDGDGEGRAPQLGGRAVGNEEPG
jgi:hypothetical protein